MADTSAPSSSTVQSTETPAPAPQRPRRRWWRWLATAVTALLLLVAVLVGTAWWWMSQSDSLATTLQRVARWLPADQTLEASGVEGSLRHGGKIGALRWSSPTMQVELEDATIGWQLRPLLSRELRMGTLHIGTLRLRNTPDPKKDSPTEPLQSLELPVRVDIPFQIDTLVWQGPPEVEATAIKGHYRYTSGNHQLAVHQVRWAEGSYAAQLQLQGAAPMALEAQLRGTIQTTIPPSDIRLQTLATAHVSGTLSGAQAELQLKANAYAKDMALDDSAAPESPSSPPDDPADIADSQTLRAQIQAQLAPWQPQPVISALAQLHQVDLSLFWPAGPHTLLSGELRAGPADGGWNLRAELRNAIPGAWDLKALPVHQLEADVRQSGTVWTVQEAQINLGTGHLSVQGSLDTALQSVQGTANLHQINPAAVWSTLDAAPLKGQVTAQTRTGEAGAPAVVDFRMDIGAATGPATGRVVRPRSGSTPLRIESAQAQGSWQAPRLTLQDVHLHALQAQLDSAQLQLDTETLLLQTKAQLKTPGLQLTVDGNIGPEEGTGQAVLQLTSLPQLAAWLHKLPGLEGLLKGAQLEGSADADLQWKGGWRKLQQRLQHVSAPPAASGLQLKAHVRSAGLKWRPAGADATPIHIAQLALDLQGSPERMQLTLATQVQHGAQRITLDTALQGGLSGQCGAAALDWEAEVMRLLAQWNPGTPGAGTWKAELAGPVKASQHTVGQTVRGQRIEASAGQLRVTAPAGQVPAGIQWQPIKLNQAGNGSWQIQSQGQLQGIPLAWVDAFSTEGQKGPLASAGISGDLSLNGRWTLDTTSKAPVADVVLERASGDIRLAAVDDDSDANVTIIRSSGAGSRGSDGRTTRQPRVPGQGMRARIQNLRLQIQTQGQEVRAQLLWDTERAGHLSADLRSQLQRSADGWIWADQAPLSGTVKADLPDIGIWAMFAPPGWRVTGSLHADVRIAGSRAAPQWDGNLNADGLSIVSLLDGLDLHNGKLRARLQGTRLDITELQLTGGQGSTARILGYSGNLTAAPQSGGTLTGAGSIAWDPHAPAGTSGMRMDIQLKADHLQVLVRPDRQLSTSGALQAKLVDGQMVLRGDLTVDRAAILLPDESAPSLDKDVVVHSAASRQAEAERRRAQTQREQIPEKGATPSTAKAPDILVNLDLGRDFALQGFGITTRLRGNLQVRGGATLSAPPLITGEIRTEQGRYRAWGQSLDVESGLIRFNGPYNDPSLDITTIRPNITVRAGVRVTGSASAPRVTLFSDPEMSDAEKLSWIVMGRDTASGGAEAALLQQAALALLSGGGTGENLAGRVGLDEIGFKGPASDSNDPNSGAALTLGKRLSKNLYVTYEQSLNGAMGTLFIFYDLSRSLTLRGQTGVQTAVDLIYTKRKD